MDYYIDRGGRPYGPYRLEDLRAMLAAGQVLPGDIVRNAATDQASTVSAVAGPPPAGPLPQRPPSKRPVPYDLHWALVLLLGVPTCGLIWIVWMFLIAAYVSKIGKGSKAIVMYVIAFLVSSVVSFFAQILEAVVSAFSPDSPAGVALQIAIWLVALLITVVPFELGNFAIKKGLEEYYNREEPIGLKLNPLLAAAFSIFYFQHHLSKIAKAKKSGAIA